MLLIGLLVYGYLTLRNDNTIIIKKADKGSTVVLMNRDDYIAEVERQLNDTKFYKKLDENPQEQFQKDIDEVIKNIELSKSTRESINPPGSDIFLIFYVLPKIHKELDSKLPLGYPGRPIVSGCGSLTENISAYVDLIPQNAFLVTLDVKSLYSNILHSDGIRACDHFMSEGGKSQEARSVISKLINLVLTKK